MKKKLRSIIFLLLLTISCTGCGNTAPDDNTEAAHIGENIFVMNISVNPEVELSVDADTGVVVGVACINKDAKKLIAGSKLDLINLPYDEAAEEFIAACADEGYLRADNNDISITVTRGEASDVIRNEYGAKMEAVCDRVNGCTDFDVSMHTECLCCHGTGKCDLCSGEAKYVCSVCSGSAGSPCDECGGDGLIPCPYCDGFGGCKDCNKTGVAVCDKCGGSGCEWCGGSGTMECKTCHGHPLCEGCEDTPGSGYHHCNGCAGTGKTSCWRCNSTGYETCPRCNGDGLCLSCHGEREFSN